MKKTINILSLALALSLCGLNANAQKKTELVDSVVYRMAAAADSSLVGRDPFSTLPSAKNGDAATVRINQSDAVRSAMSAHIRENADKTLKGYRVRIYFDNKQNSRVASQEIYTSWRNSHHDIPAYRSYANPYFKVTVGDFRTKSEAMRLLNAIKSEYPAAFVVKENILPPVVDHKHSYVADTIKVVRSVDPSKN